MRDKVAKKIDKMVNFTGPLILQLPGTGPAPVVNEHNRGRRAKKRFWRTLTHSERGQWRAAMAAK